MALTGIGAINGGAISLGNNIGGKSGFRVATRTGDSASFSTNALDSLKASVDGASLSGSLAKFKVGSDSGTYNNATGAINFGGAKINLNFKGSDGKAAFSAKDDVAIGKDGSDTYVVNKTTNKAYKWTGTGPETEEVLVNPDKTDGPKKKATKEYAASSLTFTDALNIGRSGAELKGLGTNSNVLINKAAATTITGTTDKKDTIFNFSGKVGNITGGGGSDNVFSVGINNDAGAKISLEGKGANSDASYIKLLGNAKKVAVNLDGAASMLDATGKTLTDSTVDTGSGSAAGVKAGTLNGTASTLTMNNANAAVDLGKLNKGSITMGTGANSLTINSVVGTSDAKAKITSTGNDTLDIKSINHATIDQSANKSSWMKLAKSLANSNMTLGKGENSIDASKATFNKTNITQATGGTAGTFISGKSFTGDKTSKNTISLNGDANSVSFSGTVSNVNMGLNGTGASTLAAGSLKDANVTAAGTTSNVTVKGGASNLNYTGSTGADTLSFGGAVSNSTFDLKQGENSLTASKAVKDKKVDQNLTNVSIAATGTDSQTITAKSLTTAKVNGAQGSSSITTGNGDTVINLSGSIGKNTSISLGTGKNSVSAASITGGKDAEGVNIRMATNGGTNNTQTLNVKGGANRATINMGGNDVKISMGGSLNNSNVTMGTGANSLVLSRTNKTGTKTSYGNISNTTIAANGATSNTITAGAVVGGAKVSTSITLGDGTNTVSLAGSIGSNTTLSTGTGANTIYAKAIAGTKTAMVNILSDSSTTTNGSTTLNVKGGAKNLNYVGSDGKDTLNFGGAISNANLNMGTAGGDSLSAVKVGKNSKRTLQALTNVSIAGSGVSMELGALKGKSALNLTGDNKVTLGAIAAGTTIDMGTGSNTLNITKGIAGGTGTKAVTIQFGTEANASTKTQSVTITGNVKGLNYKGSKAADDLKIIGKLSSSNIDLGSGADTLTVENSKSVAQTVTNTSISTAGTNATITAGNLTSTGRNGASSLTMGGGTLSLGNVSGKVSINMTANVENDVSVGSFNGENVKFTSAGYGTFSATSIGSKASVDFSTSASGDVFVKTSAGIGNASFKFGSNAVTIIAGTTAGETATNATSNINGATIQATNAESVKVMAKDITGATNMDLGATDATSVEVEALGKISGTTRIKANGDAIDISAASINGAKAGSAGVVIDLSGATGDTGSTVTVTGDASNFSLDGGNSTSAVTFEFNTINQNKLLKNSAASISVTNAASVDMTVDGNYSRMTYTGSKNNDTLKLVGTGSNNLIDLGTGSKNEIKGTDANTTAGDMTNTTIKGSGAETVLTLGSFTLSGGGNGGIDLTSDTSTVNIAGTLGTDAKLNGKTKNELTAGLIKGAGNSSRANIEMGVSGSGDSTLNVTGSVTNANISSSNKMNANLSGTDVTNVKMDLTGSENNVTFGAATGTGTTKLSNVETNMGKKDTDGTNKLIINSNVSVDAAKDKGFKLNMYGQSGGNIISGGGATMANSTMTVHQGKATVTLGGLTGDSTLETKDTVAADNTVTITNVNADIKMVTGKLLVDNFGSGGGNLSMSSGGGLISVKNMTGGEVSMASGGKFNLGNMTGGTASLSGAVTSQIGTIAGGLVQFNDAGSKINLQNISGGMLDVKSTNSITGYGGSVGSTIGMDNIKQGGTAFTEGVTITDKATISATFGTGDNTSLT